MKQKHVLITIITFLVFFSSCFFDHLENKYLGQLPPDRIPVIFAPGIVSSELPEHGCITFSPDLKEIYWSVTSNDYRDGKIFYTRFEKGEWLAPQLAPFSGTYRDLNPSFDPGGNRLYYFTYRPIEEKGDSIYSIWYVDRNQHEWGKPKALSKSINSGSAEGGESISAKGNLFFWSARPGSKGGCDIYTSTLQDGDFRNPVRMSDEVNSDYIESCTYIAPDESYIIFDSNRPQGLGSWDLYISFKEEGDTWAEAKNMGNEINSEYSDWFPSISPDGKYLFFVSNRNGNDDIYWVSAEIIDELNPN